MENETKKNVVEVLILIIVFTLGYLAGTYDVYTGRVAFYKPVDQNLQFAKMVYKQGYRDMAARVTTDCIYKRDPANEMMERRLNILATGTPSSSLFDVFYKDAFTDFGVYHQEER